MRLTDSCYRKRTYDQNLCSVVLKVTGDGSFGDVGEKCRLSDHVLVKAPLRLSPSSGAGRDSAAMCTCAACGPGPGSGDTCRCSLSQAECHEGSGELRSGGAGGRALRPAPPGRARLSAAASALSQTASLRRGKENRGALGANVRPVLSRAHCFHFVKKLFLCNVGFICHSHFRDENPSARRVTQLVRGCGLAGWQAIWPLPTTLVPSATGSRWPGTLMSTNSHVKDA